MNSDEFVTSWLFEARRLIGGTQEDLANILGCSRSAIAKCEAGPNMPNEFWAVNIAIDFPDLSSLMSPNHLFEMTSKMLKSYRKETHSNCYKFLDGAIDRFRSLTSYEIADGLTRKALQLARRAEDSWVEAQLWSQYSINTRLIHPSQWQVCLDACEHSVRLSKQSVGFDRRKGNSLTREVGAVLATALEEGFNVGKTEVDRVLGSMNGDLDLGLPEADQSITLELIARLTIASGTASKASYAKHMDDLLALATRSSGSMRVRALISAGKLCRLLGDLELAREHLIKAVQDSQKLGLRHYERVGASYLCKLVPRC